MALVTAHPSNPDIPTVGPFLVDCSDCGPVGIATSTLVADLMVLRHSGAHVGIDA